MGLGYTKSATRYLVDTFPCWSQRTSASKRSAVGKRYLVRLTQETPWILWLRMCYTSIFERMVYTPAHALIVKGWRARSDGIMSNTRRDHGSKKRQTSEAISQKTQSATPHAVLRSAGVTKTCPRLS